MSGASFGGLISGLDTNTIIEQLVAIERRPIDRLETKRSEQQQLLSIYSDAKSKLSALRTAVQALDTHQDFKKVSATSGDDEIFTVSANSSASAGVHSLKVLTLAQSEMEVSQGYATMGSEVGTGTISLTVGTETTDITINSTNNSLDGLRDAINNSDAEVTASIVNDGDASNPYRLVITSNESGTANAMTIDASGLSGGTAPTFTDGSVEGEPGQQAVDATMMFDGISITKSSNEIDDLLEGVTINLHDVDLDTSYSLVLESNNDAIGEKVEAVVAAYNEFHDWIEGQKSADKLSTDYALETMDRELRSMLTGGVSGLDGQTYSTLSQVGVSFSREGVLEFDSEDFSDALDENFDEVMKIFTAYAEPSSSNIQLGWLGDNVEAGSYAIEITGVGDSFGATIDGHATNVYSGYTFTGGEGYSEEGLNLQFTGDTAGSYGTVDVTIGIMELLDRKIKTYTDIADGTIKQREEAINTRIRNYDTQIDRKEESLLKYEERQRAKFTQMEMLLSQMQTQSNSLVSM